jgi:hypothetical protein
MGTQKRRFLLLGTQTGILLGCGLGFTVKNAKKKYTKRAIKLKCTKTVK